MKRTPEQTAEILAMIPNAGNRRRAFELLKLAPTITRLDWKYFQAWVAATRAPHMVEMIARDLKLSPDRIQKALLNQHKGVNQIKRLRKLTPIFWDYFRFRCATKIRTSNFTCPQKGNRVMTFTDATNAADPAIQLAPDEFAPVSELAALLPPRAFARFKESALVDEMIYARDKQREQKADDLRAAKQNAVILKMQTERAEKKSGRASGHEKHILNKNGSTTVEFLAFNTLQKLETRIAKYDADIKKLDAQPRAKRWHQHVVLPAVLASRKIIATLQDADLPECRPAKTKDYQDELNHEFTLRKAVDAIKAAPRPKRDIMVAIEKAVDEIAAPPDLTQLLTRNPTAEVQWPEKIFFGPLEIGTQTVRDATPLLAWLSRDQMKAKLSDLLDLYCDDSKAIPSDEIAERVAKAEAAWNAQMYVCEEAFRYVTRGGAYPKFKRNPLTTAAHILGLKSIPRGNVH
jgi:hypothetical protein